MYKKGLTLVEIVVALGIFSIIISLVFSITGSGRISWTIAAAKLYVSSQERQASTVISQELVLSRYGTKAWPATDGHSIRFSIPLVGDDEELQLSGGGDLLWGDGTTQGNSIEYSVINEKLVRRVLDASLTEISIKSLAQNVTNFTVSIPGGGQYDINIVFDMDRYLGTELPSPITANITFAVTPMN